MGIGGGGDVVGALAAAELARAFGAEAIVGGVTWERLPIDSRPGARPLGDVRDARRLNDAVALADGRTTGPGFDLAEARMAFFLDEPTVLVDPNGGPAAVADGLADAAARLDCDLVVLLDVGGDALAHGDEPGLASPLCDAVMLAAAPRLAERVAVAGAVFGAGCDGELDVADVLARVAEVAAAGGLLGAWGLTPGAAARLEGAIAHVHTEASAQAVACARGALGAAAIRGGRRQAQRSPVGAVSFWIDPRIAIASTARLARAVIDAGSLEAANEILNGLGVRTELDDERASWTAAAGTKR